MSTLDERLAQRTSLGTWTFDNRFEYRFGLGRIYSDGGPVICELCYYITSPGGTFTLRSVGSVSYGVDWGDGSSETSTSNDLAHTYAAGDYIIKITSAVPYRTFFNNVGDEDLITRVDTTDIDFGTTLAGAWYGASNLTTFNAAFGVTDGVTSFNNTWRGCAGLTGFPLIDTSSGSTFIYSWAGCTGLTSFPLIDVSSGTNFNNAWRYCTSLTDFPANFFDSWTGTPTTDCFSLAWSLCSSLTATSVENILNSIDTSGQSAPASGVDITIDYNASSGTPDISTAVTNLKSRGWTVTLNGVAQTGDTDALTYIAAVETADGQTLESGVKAAYVDFVLGCKSDGIWNAIKSSCILAGARTLAGALVPLVGTAPTNNNFVSGDYNRETGLVGNGSTKYLDSNRAGNTDPQDSFHQAVNVTQSANGTYIGTNYTTNSEDFSHLFVTAGNLYITNRNAVGVTVSAAGPTIGFIGSSRSLSSGYSYRYGGVNVSDTRSSLTSKTDTSLIFARNQSPASNFSAARISFYSIGESLDLALLDTRVSNLITAIGAAIP